MTLRVSVDEIVESEVSGVLSIHPTWTRVRLGDVATVQNGFPFKSSGFSRDRGVPLLRIRDVGNNDPDTFFDGQVDPAFVVRGGDIVVGMDGDFRAARWTGPDAALNQRVCRIVPFTQLYNERFLFLALQPYLDAVNRATSAITVKHLSSATVNELPLPLPPLEEQVRIVTTVEEAFSKLDAGEAGLRTVCQLLKRMRAAVLLAAVSGRLLPQVPTDTAATKLLSDLGVEPVSGMFDLPPTWAWAPLGAMLREPLRNGMSAVKADASTGLPTFSITAVTTGDFSGANIKYTVGDWGRAEGLWAEPGDLFVQRSNTPELVGTARLYRGAPKAAIFPDLLIRVRAVPELRPQWLEVYMASAVCRAFVRGQSKGLAGSMPKIAQPVLERLAVPVAPEDEQDRIIAEIDRQFSFIDACGRAVEVGLARSAVLRRSVLKAAFEGQLVPQDSSDEPASELLKRILIDGAKPIGSSGRPRRNKVEAQ